MDSPIQRYLEDAIAAEKSFETQLTGFADEASLPQARELFERHADETRTQYQQLTTRLEALGGSVSSAKSFLAHLFNMSPKMAQLGHEAQERTTQDLIMAFAVENAEVAMYEALSIAAESAGDSETANLARRIQAEEQATAEKIWPFISTAAQDGLTAATAKEGVQQTVIRYLQDVEAAERNFEDALASFSKSGDRREVQSLMSMMSDKARTQHERLYARLQALGGDRSAGKSLLAHLLAFTPVTAQMGHSASEKSTQHLMITYAAAAAEMGMYEALATAARLTEDSETEQLARQLQREEKEDHILAWRALPETARAASELVLSKMDK
jgi:ferritin-like metal-binding protein YciE